ncbi:MAG: DNA polymerase III subunit delta [Oscillospiraceae bacterium]|nr:DNA polymerase III subunit delta [Oscillospiraceae bacterium]
MPPKKDDSLKKLKQDLKEDKIGNLYLFHGEEDYLRRYYLDLINKRLLTPGLEVFQLHCLSGKEATIKAIREAVDCLPMGGGRPLVLVTDCDLFKLPKDGREELCALLEDLSEDVCLIFIYDVLEYKPDGRTKLAKLLQRKGKIIAFPSQSQGDLADWVIRRFRALDRDINGELARYLIFLCGDLMAGLSEEIAKIAAYTEHRQITRGDIDAVAIPQLDARVFQMTDAVLDRDFDRAAQVLGELLSQQEAPIMILSVLGKQLRQLYTARLGLQAGKGKEHLAQLWYIHSYPAEKLVRAAPRFSLPWCRRAVCRAAETDLAMKSSGGDAEDLLTSFLLELAHG